MSSAIHSDVRSVDPGRRLRSMPRARRAAGVGVLVASLCTLTACATTESRLAAEQQSRRARSHFNLGVDHLENGRMARGLRELLTAERYAPKDPNIQYGLGRAYLGKGKTDESEAHLLRAIEIFPDHHDARLTLSGLYVLLERYDDSAEHSQVLLDDPTFPAPWLAHTNLGWIHLRQGDRIQARREFEFSLEYNERHWQSVLNLGILEGEDGKHVEALRAYEKVLQLTNSPSAIAEVNYRIAQVYVTMGKRKRAVQHLMVAVANSPDSQWGLKSEEYLKLLR